MGKSISDDVSNMSGSARKNTRPSSQSSPPPSADEATLDGFGVTNLVFRPPHDLLFSRDLRHPPFPAAARHPEALY